MAIFNSYVKLPEGISCSVQKLRLRNASPRPRTSEAEPRRSADWWRKVCLSGSAIQNWLGHRIVTGHDFFHFVHTIYRGNHGTMAWYILISTGNCYRWPWMVVPKWSTSKSLHQKQSKDTARLHHLPGSSHVVQAPHVEIHLALPQSSGG